MYIRDPISGTYLGFQELALDKGAYGQGFKAATSYEAIVQAVASDANAIGYSSVELATNAGVKGVSIEGVPPTIASVNEGKYGYARVLRFYSNKSTEKPSAKEFVDFVQSPAGQKILVDMGFVPLP
jgi:phosphate transport system substrate-binding protein